jgi:hypothetical protein
MPAIRNKWAITLVLALLTVFLAPSAWAAPPAGNTPATPPKTVRLLNVGNSFSFNATHYLPDLVKAAGHVLIHKHASMGGGTLAQHCEKYRRHAEDPKDPKSLYIGKVNLVGQLEAEPWDFITIQQASLYSHDISTYRPFAKDLCAIIKKHAPHAEILLHQTWAYRCDDPRFHGKGKPGDPKSQEAMYRGLTDAYQTIAAELHLRLIPCGDALFLADTDPVWGFKPDTAFNFQTAQAPALPNQTHSLHVGWRWNKGKLAMDGHHAGLAGEYLGACVFFECLYGQSAVGNTFVPKGLDADYARFLQQTAHRAVSARTPRGTPRP